MKPLLLLISLLLITYPSYSAPIPIPNDSFEGNSSPPIGSSFDNWYEIGTQSGITHSSAQSNSGTWSCRFTNPTTSYDARGVRSFQIDVEGGKVYKVGCWGYLVDENSLVYSSTISWLWVSIEWFDAESSPCDPPQNPSDGTTFTEFGIWTEFSTADITAPSNAVTATIYIRCKEDQNANNDIYVDDVFLDSQEPSIPETTTITIHNWREVY